MYQLLTCDQMYEADRLTMATGVPGIVLMERAGSAVAAEILSRWQSRPTLVLCGPGNNGGDGFVIARKLAEAGWPVTVALLGDWDRLSGDAGHHAAKWDGDVLALDAGLLGGAELVVDALFGAGLARPMDGLVADVVHRLSEMSVPIVSVDVPSGVRGDDGGYEGAVVAATLTVTFCRAKPAHFLMPGRALTGELAVADIGITVETLEQLELPFSRNLPSLWQDEIRWPSLQDHKYTRGHVLVLGGTVMTGAGRLAARAARRAGAGLLTVAAERSVLPIYAADQPGVITAPLEELQDVLADPRKNVVLVGPGFGVGEATRWRVLEVLRLHRSVVLDADALTSFVEEPSTLFFAIRHDTVLTPHDGEFARLFPEITASDRLSRARAAAKRAGAVVVLKGADTVIAAPDGRAAINDNAPPWLASGGTGDVLGGLIAGLLAPGMPPFEAACMAVWLHGAAADAIGPGLIAEDLPDALPALLRKLYDAQRHPSPI